MQIEYLVKWLAKPDHEATWVITYEFVKLYPDFPLAAALANVQS